MLGVGCGNGSGRGHRHRRNGLCRRIRRGREVSGVGCLPDRPHVAGRLWCAFGHGRLLRLRLLLPAAFSERAARISALARLGTLGSARPGSVRAPLFLRVGVPPAGGFCRPPGARCAARGSTQAARDLWRGPRSLRRAGDGSAPRADPRSGGLRAESEVVAGSAPSGIALGAEGGFGPQARQGRRDRGRLAAELVAGQSRDQGQAGLSQVLRRVLCALRPQACERVPHWLPGAQPQPSAALDSPFRQRQVQQIVRLRTGGLRRRVEAHASRETG